MINVLKVIGIAILTVIVLILLAALFVKKDFNTECSVEINQPRDTVFDYLVMLKNQEAYSVWYAIDPAMQKSSKGTDGTVGFVVVWDSENPDAGKGEQEIRAIIPGERIDFELRLSRPFRMVSELYFLLEDAGENRTLVRWGYSGRMKYPLNLMLLFYNPEAPVCNDLEKGLANLKAILESKP